MPEDMPGRMPEAMPDRMPDKMPEDMSDRMPEDLPVTKRIDVMVGITRSKVILTIAMLVYQRVTSPTSYQPKAVCQRVSLPLKLLFSIATDEFLLTGLPSIFSLTAQTRWAVAALEIMESHGYLNLDTDRPKIGSMYIHVYIYMYIYVHIYHTYNSIYTYISLL